MPSTGEQHSVLSPGSYVEACPSRVSCLVGGNVEVCSLDGQPTPRTSSPPQTLRCCKISQLTFILLCLMPSTICSICLKNWSRAAGEAMALKERSPEVCLCCNMELLEGGGDTQESALNLDCSPTIQLELCRAQWSREPPRTRAVRVI